MSDLTRRWMHLWLAVGLLAIGLLATGPSVLAQQPPPSSELAVAAEAVAQANTAGPPAMLTYANRPIVLFRVSFLGRSPAERVIAAQLLLDRFAEARVAGPFEVRSFGGLRAIALAGRDIFAIMPADVDTLAGETLDEVTELARTRLQTALGEAIELRRPRQVLVGVLQAFLATVTFVVLLFGLLRARTWVSRRVEEATTRRIQGTAVRLELVRASRVVEFLHRLLTFAIGVLSILLAYSWLTFVLARFPYTRPWAESLRGLLFSQILMVGRSMVDALPGLFMVGVIVVLTRFVSRFAQLFFQAIEDGRITVPWIYPETAQSTRKLVGVGLWLFALAIAYPYLPGSESEAFQGVSVFVGLVVSLGSSGLVNQVMSGFTLTYSRALRVGDFVTIGETEGTVTLLGTLSTKIKTVRGEDVTIPNAVMVSQVVTNHSRFADAGVFVPTSITIGYDVPWRQVQALMLLAASRTPGVRSTPAPVVRQPSLQDFYVKYTLLFCLERPADRAITIAAVNANILDAFNEYGVQITSPNYEADPETKKIVPRDQWFAAPAVAPEGQAATSSADSASGSPAPPRG